MEIARQVATRSTCDRANVGAILVREKQIVSSGYNGSLPGHPHCSEVGHLIVDNHCILTSHAEANLIAQAAKFGASTNGTICYISHHPCLTCLKLLISAGVRKIIYGQPYRTNEIPVQFLSAIELVLFAGQAT